MALNKKKIEEQVLTALDQLRPFLHDDGGDIEFVEVLDDGTVTVRLLGACSDCSMSVMTLKAGLEENVRKAVPEVKAIVAINEASIA